MDIKITPSKLCGTVKIPPSKSVAHRLIISAALAKGKSIISNVYPSKDICATINAMKTLGAEITLLNTTAIIKGIENPPKKAIVDCNESGSTLRFLIPVACALGVECTFVGKGKLPERPITPYLEELPKHGIQLELEQSSNSNAVLPLTVKGKLTSGRFEINGGISSQFITGLLLALPIVDGNSEIILTSRLESRPYVDITLDCLKKFGANITENQNGYYIKGKQKLLPCNCETEGDYSQAAFFKVANSLGCDIKIEGLNQKSFQGDKKIIEICDEMVYNKNNLKPFNLDCSDIPDLVPVLTVLAAFCCGESKITNVARLRIKECDRLNAISTCLNSVGAKVCEYPDKLIINGVQSLKGGTIESYNDHRIPMSMAVAAVKCKEPLIIRGAECVSKSYPDFWEDYKALGGKVNVINME